MIIIKNVLTKETGWCKMQEQKAKKIKFELDKRWSKTRNWLDRFCARHVAKMLLNEGGLHSRYEFSNYPIDKNEYHFSCFAHKTQLAHWVLREAGYKCCSADLEELIGLNPAAKESNL